MPGNIVGTSGLDGEKEDLETSNLKDVLLRKLQEVQCNKAKKSENLDQLESFKPRVFLSACYISL